MKIGRNVIVAIMITFCFTVTLFLAIPIRSANSPYNPWIDYNDDGQISLQDLVSLANSYGTTGDPTKNVNITNPTAITLQEDLNISIINWTGWGSIDPFATVGYDRMFVSAGVIDVSNYNSSVSALLTGVNWIWGLVNGKYLTTTTPVNSSNSNDSHGQVYIYVYNATTDIPMSSPINAELPVEAGNCSLPFSAHSSFQYGWVKIRVSIYLTVGTTSPPSIQKTYVTNMPSVQPQPSSITQSYYFNSAINGGYGSSSLSLPNIGGYSRMFASIEIEDASYQGVFVQTTISLTSVQWSEGGYENVLPGVLNATYYGTGLPVYSQQVPPEFTTKNSACTLYFSITSGATSGWIYGWINVYLRNE